MSEKEYLTTFGSDNYLNRDLTQLVFFKDRLIHSIGRLIIIKTTKERNCQDPSIPGKFTVKEGNYEIIKLDPREEELIAWFRLPNHSFLDRKKMDSYWDSCLISFLIKNNWLRLAKAGRSLGKPFYPNNLEYSILKGSVEMTKLIANTMKNSKSFKEWSCLIASDAGKLEQLQTLRKLGAPWCPLTCLYVLINAYKPIIEENAKLIVTQMHSPRWKKIKSEFSYHLNMICLTSKDRYIVTSVLSHINPVNRGSKTYLFETMVKELVFIFDTLLTNNKLNGSGNTTGSSLLSWLSEIECPCSQMDPVVNVPRPGPNHDRNRPFHSIKSLLLNYSPYRSEYVFPLLADLADH